MRKPRARRRPLAALFATPWTKASLVLLTTALLGVAACSAEGPGAETGETGAAGEEAPERARSGPEFPEGFPAETFPFHEEMTLYMAGRPNELPDRTSYVLRLHAPLPPDELMAWYLDTFEAQGWTDNEAAEENTLWYTKDKEIATLTFTPSEDGGSDVALSYRLLK